MATKEDIKKKINSQLNDKSKAAYYQSPSAEASQDVGKAEMYQTTPPAEEKPFVAPDGSKADFMQNGEAKSLEDVGKAELYSPEERNDVQTTQLSSETSAKTTAPDLSQIKVARDVKAPDGWERVMQAIDPNRPLSPQEQERLERRRKSDALFSALGDSLTALSDIYFASEGAYIPDPTSGLSATAKERWDKIKAEREAKDLRFYENVQRREAERRKLEAASKLSPYEQEMMKWRMRNTESKDNYLMAENQRKAAADQAKAEETKRVNDARIANYNSQIYKRATADGNTNRYYTIPVHLSDDEIVDVDARYLKDRSIVNKLFNFLPEADRLVAGSKDSKGNYKSPTLDEMMRAVFAALPNNADMQEYLRQLSKKQQPTAAQKPATKPTTPTKDFSQYKETKTKDWSQYKRK